MVPILLTSLHTNAALPFISQELLACMEAHSLLPLYLMPVAIVEVPDIGRRSGISGESQLDDDWVREQLQKAVLGASKAEAGSALCLHVAQIMAEVRQCTVSAFHTDQG